MPVSTELLRAFAIVYEKTCTGLCVVCTDGCVHICRLPAEIEKICSTITRIAGSVLEQPFKVRQRLLVESNTHATFSLAYVPAVDAFESVLYVLPEQPGG
jgi:hypothetical protein